MGGCSRLPLLFEVTTQEISHESSKEGRHREAFFFFKGVGISLSGNEVCQRSKSCHNHHHRPATACAATGGFRTCRSHDLRKRKMGIALSAKRHVLCTNLDLELGNLSRTNYNMCSRAIPVTSGKIAFLNISKHTSQENLSRCACNNFFIQS